MNIRLLFRSSFLSVTTFLCSAAYADLYKCVVDGKVVYQQIACFSGEEKALDDSQRRMYLREKEARIKQENNERETRNNENLAIENLKNGGNADSSDRRAKAEQNMRAYFDRILFDPSSVQFRSLKIILDVPGSKLRSGGSKTTPLVDVVCGEVNSKNRFGGYVGFRYFLWDSDSKRVSGSLDGSDLNTLLQELTRDKCLHLN